MVMLSPSLLSIKIAWVWCSNGCSKGRVRELKITYEISRKSNWNNVVNGEQFNTKDAIVASVQGSFD